MLALEIAFPSGRFYGARADEPDLPEWPPHPSRVYSALVASAAADGLNGPKRDALRWLECQSPPAIEAPHADYLSSAPTSYVPPGDFNSQQGRNEHPCIRIRKDRHFPAVYLLAKPVVRYIWDATPPLAVHTSLNEMTRRMTHVGTSHSMVLARIVDVENTSATWRPERNGTMFLRVPVSGRLDELETLFENDFNVRRPPSAFEPEVAYRSGETDGVLDNPTFSRLMRFRITDSTHDLTSAEKITRALRTSVMSRIRDPIPEEIHGHWDGPHVGWLPLADVRPPVQQAGGFARGRILGVGIAIPRGMSSDSRHQLLSALGELQTHGIHLSERVDLGFEPLSLGRKPPQALSATTWCYAGRAWATVTPVVPDRLPRKSKSPLIESAVVDSLRRAGFPEPANVQVSRYSRFQGAPSTEQYRMPLPRFHAVVEFPQPVRGPVTAGRLRYFGIGLFRPVQEEA